MALSQTKYILKLMNCDNCDIEITETYWITRMYFEILELFVFSSMFFINNNCDEFVKFTKFGEWLREREDNLDLIAWKYLFNR